MANKRAKPEEIVTKLHLLQMFGRPMCAFPNAQRHPLAGNAAVQSFLAKRSTSSTPSTMELMEDVEGFIIRRAGIV